MKHHGSIDLKGNELLNVTLRPESNFPLVPKVGSFLFKQKRVLICVEDGGLPVWVPLTQTLNTVLHVQNSATDTWTIPHQLESSHVIVQVFDQDNKVIIPDEINCSTVNSTVITFNESVAGRAVLMLGDLNGTPRLTSSYEQDFYDTATVVVTHGLGVTPAIRAFVGGQEVQPASIVHDSNVQTTVTFSSAQSGTIRCI